MTPYPRPRRAPLALLTALSLSGAVVAQVRPLVDETGILRGWSWESQGIILQQVQRLPDQTRAFFLGRGFSSEAANRLAGACVFQTILRNEGPEPIEVDLGEWRIRALDLPGADFQPIRLTADWQRDWESLGVTQAARIAFQWAMFPHHQTFESKDWNMGMISYSLPPGSRFDLQARMRRNGETLTALLPGLECAPDVAAETLPKLTGDR